MSDLHIDRSRCLMPSTLLIGRPTWEEKSPSYSPQAESCSNLDRVHRIFDPTAHHHKIGTFAHLVEYFYEVRRALNP